MITAGSIMTESVIKINENATATEAAKLILKRNISGLVVTRNNLPIAVVTINDLIKGVVNISPKVKVKDMMSNKFHIMKPNSNYSQLVDILKGKNIKIFPIVKNKKLIGIITETDIVDATRDFTRFHQIMQEIILTVFGLVTALFLFLFSPLGQSIKKFLA